MHGQGIAGALWSAGRRRQSVFFTTALVASRPFAIAAILVLATLLGSTIPRASAAPTEYTYTGTDYSTISCILNFGSTSCTPSFTTSEKITGYIITANPLPALSLTNPVIDAYSFSDGIDTFSSPTPAGYFFGHTQFGTNASGQIISGGLNTFDSNLGAAVKLIHIGPTGPVAAEHGSSSGITEGQSLTPGTWSGPEPTGVNSPVCGTLLKNAVSISLGGNSGTGLPYNIAATFTPKLGAPLKSAEQACNVANFDWQQYITVDPAPAPLAAASNPSKALTAPPKFLDPPPGGYYSVASGKPVVGDCSSFTIGSLITFYNPTSADPNPFYYDTNPALPHTDCGSLDFNQTNTTLSFFDSPADPLLSPSEALAFQTCLVGVDNKGNPVDLPSTANDCFKWTDSYTGGLHGCITFKSVTTCVIGTGNGGIIQYNSVLTSGYPNDGIGGITITSIPEPPTETLLCVAVLALCLLRCDRAYIFLTNGNELSRQYSRSRKGIYQICTKQISRSMPRHL